MGAAGKRIGAGKPAGGVRSGLAAAVRREVIVAAIHLHTLEQDDAAANIEAVRHAPGLHDAVVIGFARREQGLLVAPGNPHGIGTIAQIAGSGLRMAQRQEGAGAQLLLLTLLAREQIDPRDIAVIKPAYATGSDLAQAIRAGHADCGIATRAVAQAAGLDFVPLVWENFDLVLRQRDYFLPGPSALFGFVRSDRFRQRAAELGGYDLSVLRYDPAGRVSQIFRICRKIVPGRLKMPPATATRTPTERWPSG